MPLQDLDVSSVGGGEYSQSEVIYIGEGQTAGDLGVETGDVDHEPERGDRGALGGANQHRGEHPGGPLVPEPARPARQERPGPRHKIRVNPFGSEHAAEGGGVEVVEAPFYVQKESGNLPLSDLEGPHLMSEGGYCVRGGEASQRTALVRVKEAHGPGHTGESRVHDPLEDLGKRLEQDNNTERGGGVV